MCRCNQGRIWDESLLDYLTLHPKTSVLSKDTQSREAQEEGRAPQSLHRKRDRADAMTWTTGLWNDQRVHCDGYKPESQVDERSQLCELALT